MEPTKPRKDESPKTSSPVAWGWAPHAGDPANDRTGTQFGSWRYGVSSTPLQKSDDDDAAQAAEAD